MIALPFLLAFFLLINPLLLAIFTRLEIQLEKLQFWLMVSTGTAWLLSCVFLALGPNENLNPIWDAGAGLLPSLAFSLDRISACLILAVSGVLFYITLVRQENPRSNALITGLGGVSGLGLLADSAYTLALAWTALELLTFYISYPFISEGRLSRRYAGVMILRLAAPGSLVLLSLTGSRAAGSGFISDWGAEAAIPVIAAGMIGFLGWFLTPGAVLSEGKDDPARLFFAWIPGMVGMLLVIRGGTLLEGPIPFSLYALAAGVLLLLVSLGGLLFDLTEKLWFIGCGLLAAGAALLAMPFSGLSWAVVFMIPASLLWLERSRPQMSLPALGLAGLGILPLPFLPAWAGAPPFQSGIPGSLLAAGCGLFLGGVVIAVLKNWRKDLGWGEVPPLVEILGAAALLISQVLIGYRLEGLEASQGLLSRPISIWLPLLLVLVVIIAGNWIPLRSGDRFQGFLERAVSWLGKALTALLRTLDKLVAFLSSTLEGDGGLIWALLLGILMITLLTIRGGG